MTTKPTIGRVAFWTLVLLSALAIALPVVWRHRYLFSYWFGERIDIYEYPPAPAQAP